MLDRRWKLTFLFSEVRVDLAEGLQQPILFHKGEECHALPGVLLAVQVNLEVRGV